MVTSFKVGDLVSIKKDCLEFINLDILPAIEPDELFLVSRILSRKELVCTKSFIYEIITIRLINLEDAEFKADEIYLVSS